MKIDLDALYENIKDFDDVYMKWMELIELSYN